jgi:hypothetical protein
MSKSIFTALTVENCGADLIRYAGWSSANGDGQKIHHVQNARLSFFFSFVVSALCLASATSVTRSLPTHFRSAHGDISTLLRAFDAFIGRRAGQGGHVKNSTILQQLQIPSQSHHLLERAYSKWVQLDKAFLQSKEFRLASQKHAHS